MRSASGAAVAQALSDFSYPRLWDTGTIDVWWCPRPGGPPNTSFMKLIHKHDIKYHISEPRRPNQNPAESAIRELKRKW